MASSHISLKEFILTRNYRKIIIYAFLIFGLRWLRYLLVKNGKQWMKITLITELVNTYERELENWAEDNSQRMKYIDRYKEIKNTGWPSQSRKRYS